jgi:hypothetical protein
MENIMIRSRFVAYALVLAASSTLAASPHDHTSNHGGLVLMDGELHFELLVGFDGRHRVHYTDGRRRPLPPSAMKSVHLTIKRGTGADEELTLLSGEGGAWSGKGRLIDGATVDVTLTHVTRAGHRYSIDVPVTRALSDQGYEQFAPHAGSRASSGRQG